MEVISGYYYNIAEYNNYQIVRWFESGGGGKNIPPMGVNILTAVRRWSGI